VNKTGELHFNTDQHLAVYVARTRHLPLYFVIGPGGITVDCETVLAKAQGYIHEKVQPNMFFIRMQKTNGSLTDLPPYGPKGNFQLVDLISRPIKK